MNIAVIGAGISGLITADCLSRRHQVTLYEAEERIGGHTNTIHVPLPDGGTQAIDTGWIVYNTLNYPNLSALLDELQIATRATRMSFGVSLDDGRYEYMGSDRLWSVFAQPSNLLSLRHLRMLVDILRLNARCRKLLRDQAMPQGSLGEFLDRSGLSPWLSSRYLLPMAGMIWSCSPRQARQYPAASFLRFFDSHALFTATQQPVWRTVVGGSDRYLQPLRQRFSGRLLTATPVQALLRGDTETLVCSARGREAFDAVVCATHADQTLAMLGDDADPLERRLLSGMPYGASRCVLHTDTSFLPRRRAAWASWNYLNDKDEVHDRPVTGSYWMNGLQGIPGSVNYVVTLNPTRPIPQDRILYETVYQHPQYGPESVETQARLGEIQGRRRCWFAGAWTRYGFHEDGLLSGLRVVNAIDPGCLPPWAELGA